MPDDYDESDEYSEDYPCGGMVDRYDAWREEQLLYEDEIQTIPRPEENLCG